jgi:Asp/Glu/hydantoin racemase
LAVAGEEVLSCFSDPALLSLRLELDSEGGLVVGLAAEVGSVPVVVAVAALPGERIAAPRSCSCGL